MQTHTYARTQRDLPIRYGSLAEITLGEEFMIPRSLIALCALAFAALHPVPQAQAQSYPSKPVTIVVPLAPGSGMDTLVRLYADELQKALGKPVVVENKPGAGPYAARLDEFGDGDQPGAL
jgi:hypothetical protein